MRSQNSEKFNHDNQAHLYDKEVKNEIDPVRAGYSKTLDAIIYLANIDKNTKVLEFGSGTGNLTSKINNCKSIMCIDLSEKMEEESKEKCSHLKNKTFRKSDFLEFFTNNNEDFDLIISSYALHHLTDEEKKLFLRKSKNILRTNGKIIIGDLMVSSKNKLEEVKKKYINKKAVYDSFIEEYYWICEEILDEFKLDFSEIEINQISELSSVIIFQK